MHATDPHAAASAAKLSATLAAEVAAIEAEPVPPLLAELRALAAELRDEGLPAQLYTLRDVLLIGTPGGGIITAGLNTTRTSWWANSVTSCHTHDLTGATVTAAIRAEISRHRELASTAEHRDDLDYDARLQEIA